MSGAEVVGLVLGAIPLVISGLEHYAEGCRAMKKMFNAEQEFNMLKLSLRVENRIFSNSIVDMLKQDEIGDMELAAVVIQVTDAKGPPLDSSIDDCLRRRLGGSYEIYVESARSMARTIESLHSSLQLDNNGKGPFTADKSSFKRAWSSVKFGLKDKRYERMIADITTNNQRLARLAESQSKVTQPTELPKKAHGSRDRQKAREHARTLFPILQKVMAGNCSIEHTACLYMKPVEAHGKSECPQDFTALRVIMHHQVQGVQPSLWRAQETEVRLIKAMPAIDPDRRNPKRVRFDPVSSEPHMPPGTLWNDLEEIHDLCGKLQIMQLRPAGLEVCLGYLAETPRNSRHCIYRPAKPFLDERSAMLSLADILDRRNGHRLGFADKTYLAHALACGMLRLYQTPWLESQWGKEDIVLFRRRRRIEASHPFVCARIAGGTIQPAASQPIQAKYFTPCSSIKEQTIFALGLLLIEIALDKPFKELRPEEQLSPQSISDRSSQQFPDFSAAANLLDDVEDQAGKRYADVVRRCILCDFGSGTSSLDDATFRSKVEAGVLLELKQEVMDLDSL